MRQLFAGEPHQVVKVTVPGYSVKRRGYDLVRCRDADETVSWIAEKDAVLSSDDFGKDLASVQTLQRKHEGIERDLAALEVRKLEI